MGMLLDDIIFLSVRLNMLIHLLKCLYDKFCLNTAFAQKKCSYAFPDIIYLSN